MEVIITGYKQPLQWVGPSSSVRRRTRDILLASRASHTCSMCADQILSTAQWVTMCFTLSKWLEYRKGLSLETQVNEEIKSQIQSSVLSSLRLLWPIVILDICYLVKNILLVDVILFKEWHKLCCSWSMVWQHVHVYMQYLFGFSTAPKYLSGSLSRALLKVWSNNLYAKTYPTTAPPDPPSVRTKNLPVVVFIILSYLILFSAAAADHWIYPACSTHVASPP